MTALFFDKYLLAMLAAMALAFAFPQLGLAEGPLRLGVVTQLGIALVFFLHGASLSTQALRRGAVSWRLHVLVQAMTYIAFPLVGAALYFALEGVAPPEMRLGIFFLCALSSTISSAVAMTALARGNLSGAVFNATLSGLLGMVLTPALMSLVIVAGEQPFPVAEAIVDILLKLLLPFILGQLARPFLGAALEARKHITGFFDKGVIVLIVYTSFCQSVAAGLWASYSVMTILAVFGIMAMLLGLATLTSWIAARSLGLSPADQVTAVFCGSQKSLANGAPIAKILFGAMPALGMIMLPLLIYHQLQLILGSIIAPRLAPPVEET